MGRMMGGMMGGMRWINTSHIRSSIHTDDGWNEVYQV